MANQAPPPTLFLLSPATLSGKRAQELATPRAAFPTALRFHSPEGLPIGEAFAFLSSLYFRGKIAYARRFASPPADMGLDGGIFVIAPGVGLVPPEWTLTPERLARLRATPVDPKRSAYVLPLAAAARELAARLPEGGRAVLLGSIATPKYTSVLAPVLGDRLLFPASFQGAGDMRRGALLLRAARSGEELEYTEVPGLTHRGAPAQLGPEDGRPEGGRRGRERGRPPAGTQAEPLRGKRLI